MYLVDGNNPPQVLTRAGHANWTIEDADIVTGPFMLENAEDTTIASSDVTGTVTLIATADIWYETHEGALWMISQKRATSTFSGTLSGNGSGSETDYFTGGYGFNTSGTWEATVTLERSTDGGTIWVAALTPLYQTNYDNPAETEEDGAIYRVTMSDYVSGSCTYNFTITDQYTHGVVRILDYVDGNEVTATVIAELEDTSATPRWREGYWSDYRGWPKAVTIHQQRLIFGGSESFPQTIWFGQANPDDYLDFAECTVDTAAFTIGLPGQNPISWLKSQDFLLIGTSGSVGKYGDQGKPITPTSPNYREQSQIGAAPITAVMAGDALLYVERGNRRIREFTYSLASDKYVSPDLNILSPEITESGIKNIAFQTSPEPMLWCVLNDGNMATLTYRRDILSQSSPIEIVAWSKQLTDGDFESVCRIPGISFEDEIWVVVKRTIDGNDVRYVERFKPRDWGDDINDCWFVDSGLDWDNSEANDFSGLDHLIGKNVYILGDGVIEPNEVVDANGAIIIDRAASRVTVGLPYTSKLETLPLRIDPQDMAANKKIKVLDFDFLKTGYCKYGNGRFSTLTTINFNNDMNVDANAVTQELYTSEYDLKHVMFPYGSRKKQTIYIETDMPLPLIIRAISTNYDLYSY